MKSLKYLVKFCGKSPKTLWVFKNLFVLHGLHTMHVFPFQPKLIFPVKTKTIKMFRHCLVKDQNCWNQFPFETIQPLQIPVWMVENSCFNSDELIRHELCWTAFQFWTVIKMSTREVLCRGVGLSSLSSCSVIWLILRAIYWLTYTDILLCSMF